VKISVFGLGYVGCVSAACFAARGHEVVGVDTNPLKLELLRKGEVPVLEPGLAEMVTATVADGRLTVTADGWSAVHATDLSLICVGTPSNGNGSLDVAALERVATTVGEALGEIDHRHTVVVRSTVLPGTTESRVRPLLEDASQQVAGRDFGLAVNPEFLREGSSVADFAEPPKTVVGELDEASGEPLAALYEGTPGPFFRVPIGVAELVKYVDNAFHALKIAFANEIGAVSRAFDLDSHEVMRIFRSDTKLNVSPAYLTPGFSFGGSCLPKDLRALVHAARRADLDLPLLENVLPSNERHLQRSIELITALGRRRVGMFGLSFKPETDDLRESPLVELSEYLLGKGYELKIYDPGVSLARLVGANREYIDSRIPHLSTLLSSSVDEVMGHAEVCVIGAARPETIEALASSNGRRIVDLARLPNAADLREGANYVGIAW
jgi:GDP-mannose 6-dehydrogenase